jgi:Polyketide cyclase / dehydrase and lipid transport
MLKIALLAGAVIVGAALLVVVIGLLLPKSHVAARGITLHRPPEEVFRLISDVRAAPAWRLEVQNVELLAPVDGHIRFREKGRNGALTMEIVESNSPSRMVTRIADPRLPFGGIWIYDIAPTVDGSRLNITERGEIYNPIFRFVSRFILGYNRTLNTYLQNVSRKFDESSIPQDGLASTL